MKHRDFSLDVLRVVATIMVIILHVAGAGFETLGPNWRAVNVYDSLTRPCVPLFFMLSGALIIPAGSDNMEKIIGRASKIGIPLVVWSFAAILWFYFTSPNWLRAHWVTLDGWQVLRGPVMTHLWFLYTLLGLYLFLPVMQSFYRCGSRPTHALYLAAAFIGGSVNPLIAELTGGRYVGIDLAYFPVYAAYMFSGALLYKAVLNVRRGLIFALVAMLCGIGTALLTRWAAIINGSPVETFYAYSSPLVVAGSVTAFIAIRSIGASISSESFRAVISKIAPLSFGTYILHPVVLYYVFAAGLTYDTGGAWIGVPLVSVIITSITMLLVYLLRLTKITSWLAPS